MADYRALRERYSLLEICAQPELAVAVTLQPVDVIEVDAAILFSDLLLPFTPMGLDFDFVKGEGPSIDDPIRQRRRCRSAADVRAARGARRTCSRRSACCAASSTDRVPLIGFGGAPFTLAAYAIEGGPSTQLRADQGVHVRAAGGVAPALRAVRDDDGRLPARAGRGRRAGDPDLRLVGRRASDAPTIASSRCRTRAPIFDRAADAGVPLIHFGVGTTRHPAAT